MLELLQADEKRQRVRGLTKEELRKLDFQETISITGQELAVFAFLDDTFLPAGLLTLTEEGTQLKTSEFAYGTRQIDPVSLPLKDKEAIRGKKVFPAKGLPFFGGIRDAAPDAWGHRVIEALMKALANSLPESTYLLQAGSERVGAPDVRKSIAGQAKDGHVRLTDPQYLLEAAERIEEGLPIPAHLDKKNPPEGGSAVCPGFTLPSPAALAAA